MREAESEPRDDLKPGVCLSVKVRVCKRVFSSNSVYTRDTTTTVVPRWGDVLREVGELHTVKQQKARPRVCVYYTLS